MRSSRWNTANGRADAAIYLTVTLLLVAIGTMLRTVTLNWVVGPGSVVVGVVGLSALLERLRMHR